MNERPSTLGGVRILLLEDDALISIDTEDMLLSLGAASVRVAYSIEEAEAILQNEPIDAAVLDLLIGRDRSEGLAIRLVAQPLPVVLASGFQDSSTLPGSLRGVPTVDKPYTSQALHAALAKALGRLD